MFVTDGIAKKIYSLDSNGTLVRTYDVPYPTGGIAVDPYIDGVLNPRSSIVYSTLTESAIYRTDIDDLTGTEADLLLSIKGKILLCSVFIIQITL